MQLPHGSELLLQPDAGPAKPARPKACGARAHHACQQAVSATAVPAAPDDLLCCKRNAMGPEFQEFASEMVVCDEHWERMAPLAVLLDLSLRCRVPLWPAGMQGFKRLQYLSVEYPDFEKPLQPLHYSGIFHI